MRHVNLAITTFLISAHAMASDCQFPVDLKNFHKNPKEFINAPVVKLDKNCKRVSSSYFNQDQINSKDYIEIKDQQRKKLCHTSKEGAKKVCLKDLDPGANVLAGRAPIESVDRAQNLVSGYTVLNNMEQIESKKLTNGSVKKQPWSDWYWPIAVGQLSFRYGDEDMMEAYQYADLEEEDIWPWMRDYHQQHPATPADVDLLSPSEKYDLLMGDMNYTLTKQMILAGKSYYDQYGKVESWMGLCHGWAVASYMLDRPAKTIEVTAADKVTNISFRPSDLKALGTLLWATGQQRNKFVGGRCNTKDPEVDPESGRILDQKCFDNNPGSWHKAVVTQIGLNKKPFVMDATYDYEVWNHPVVSYEFDYFNPQTMEEYIPLAEAKVAIEDYDKDKFAAYRSSQTKYVVGIKMEVEYMVETMPSTNDYDEQWMDESHHAYYVYDLELDANGNIIGGEWYNNKHPDFLWTPYDDSHAQSVLDPYLPEQLSLEQITHPEILSYVQEVSSQSQPIGKVVEALIREAAKTDDMVEGKSAGHVKISK